MHKTLFYIENNKRKASLLMELTFYCRKTVDRYMPGIDKYYDQKNRVAKG